MSTFKLSEIADIDESGITCKPGEKLRFKLHEAIRTIRDTHEKILSDWCKAYLAKEYELGNDIYPGCFTLIEQESTDPREFGRKYFIRPNNKEELRMKFEDMNFSIEEEEEYQRWLKIRVDDLKCERNDYLEEFDKEKKRLHMKLREIKKMEILISRLESQMTEQKPEKEEECDDSKIGL